MVLLPCSSCCSCCDSNTLSPMGRKLAKRICNQEFSVGDIFSGLSISGDIEIDILEVTRVDYSQDKGKIWLKVIGSNPFKVSVEVEVYGGCRERCAGVLASIILYPFPELEIPNNDNPNVDTMFQNQELEIRWPIGSAGGLQPGRQPMVMVDLDNKAVYQQANIITGAPEGLFKTQLDFASFSGKEITKPITGVLGAIPEERYAFFMYEKCGYNLDPALDGQRPFTSEWVSGKNWGGPLECTVSLYQAKVPVNNDDFKIYDDNTLSLKIEWPEALHASDCPVDEECLIKSPVVSCFYKDYEFDCLPYESLEEFNAITESGLQLDSQAQSYRLPTFQSPVDECDNILCGTCCGDTYNPYSAISGVPLFSAIDENPIKIGDPFPNLTLGGSLIEEDWGELLCIAIGTPSRIDGTYRGTYLFKGTGEPNGPYGTAFTGFLNVDLGCRGVMSAGITLPFPSAYDNFFFPGFTAMARAVMAFTFYTSETSSNYRNELGLFLEPNYNGNFKTDLAGVIQNSVSSGEFLKSVLHYKYCEAMESSFTNAAIPQDDFKGPVDIEIELPDPDAEGDEKKTYTANIEIDSLFESYCWMCKEDDFFNPIPDFEPPPKPSRESPYNPPPAYIPPTTKPPDNETPPEGGKAMSTTIGPGTHLKNMLAWFNIKAKEKGCKCASMEKKMNKNGPQWCRDHMQEILDHLAREATKRRLPFVRLAAEKMVGLAIRKAEKDSA